MLSHIRKIFSPPVIAGDEEKPRIAGCLTSIKRLTAALGGVVRVESELGQGSTFTITLPYGNPAAEPGSG